MRNFDAGFAETKIQNLDRNLVYAALVRLTRAPIADRQMRERLNLERGVLEHVAEPSAGAHALEEATALADRAAVLDHRGQPTHQLVVEARQSIGREVLILAEVDPGFDHWVVRPNARTDETL